MTIEVRRPLRVAALSAITFGIYFIFWYWQINREMRDFGAGRGDSELAGLRPWGSVLAITVGAWVVIPKLVSLLRTLSRVQWIELSTSGEKRTGLGAVTAAVAAALLPLGAPVRGAGIAFALGGLIALAAFAGLVQARLNTARQASGATNERVADIARVSLA